MKDEMGHTENEVCFGKVKWD